MNQKSDTDTHDRKLARVVGHEVYHALADVFVAQWEESGYCPVPGCGGENNEGFMSETGGSAPHSSRCPLGHYMQLMRSENPDARSLHESYHKKRLPR